MRHINSLPLLNLTDWRYVTKFGFRLKVSGDRPKLKFFFSKDFINSRAKSDAPQRRKNNYFLTTTI